MRKAKKSAAPAATATTNTMPTMPTMPEGFAQLAPVSWPEIQGQAAAKRALTVALAGMHSVLIVGPRHYGKRTLKHAAESIGAMIDSKPAIATVTPCACGGDFLKFNDCACTGRFQQRWLRRIRAIEERADIVIEAAPSTWISSPVRRVSLDWGVGQVIDEIERARTFAANRVGNPERHGNTDSYGFKAMDAHASRVLELFVRRTQATIEAQKRVVSVARTIADMNQSDIIRGAHVAEACQYRVTTWTKEK